MSNDRLESLSKADLIWLIHEMEHGVSVHRALIRLQEQKQIKAYDRADELYKQASAKRKEYISMVKEYAGKPISDIPHDTMLKASRILDEANRLEREADRLYGIKT